MRILVVTIFLVITTALSAQEVLRNFALFDYNSFELTTETKALIDGMLTEIGSRKIIKVELYGHTDSDGDAQANLLLSENRVSSVKTYLSSKGITEARIVTEHFGETKPAYSNSNDAGMHKNRRVEIVFTYEAVQPIVITQAVQPAPAPVSQPTKPKRSSPITGTTQVFKVNAKNEIDITGSLGTHFIFPKNCFTDANGKSVSGDFTIEIVEVYTRDEMIRHNLNTTSNNKLLESGGMAYVRASNSDGELSLASYAQYTVEFPTDNQIKGMQLFYGDTSSGNLDWVPKPAPVTKGGDWDYAAQQSLDKYVFTSSKLGWINCDHFLLNYVVTDLVVESNDTAGVSFCLVFKDFNSIMLRDLNADEITFRNVPVGQTATIVAFRKTEAGAFYASQQVKLEDNMHQSISMVQLTEEVFQKEIGEFR